MSWLLYRYMLGELLRVMALTTGVLVTVIAFGATIKPLATGMLAPEDVLKYVGLAMVPMLQFALPFAAGFAATLVFHRLANDNEVLAMSASGMSYRRILMPIVGLGIVLTVCMLLLVHFVVPQFWVLMKLTLEKDVTRMFESAVANREAFEFGSDVQIFADDLRIVTDPDLLQPWEAETGSQPPGAATPVKRLLLSKVAVVELDGVGRVHRDITGRLAAVDFYEHNGRTFLTVTVKDGYLFDATPDRRQLAYSDEFQIIEPMLVPNSFEDEPKFMSLPRLLEVRAHPDMFIDVIQARAGLVSAVRVHATWDEVERRITDEGVLWFNSHDGAARYELRADRFRANVLTGAGVNPIELMVYRGDTVEQRIRATSALLEVAESTAREVTFTLTLRECAMLEPGTGAVLYEQGVLSILDTHLDNWQTTDLLEQSAVELLRTSTDMDRDRLLTASRASLIDELSGLQNESSARIAQRTALSVTSILLLTLGAVLAMRLRESFPLTIYLVAFLPSIADLLLISGGEQMMRDDQMAVGFAVMWLGNVAMLITLMLTFFRLARN